MSDGQKTRKRKKGYYIKASQGKRACRHYHYLEPGMKGFLITCNNREKEAVREAYNILNEYADELYGPDKVCEVSLFIFNDICCMCCRVLYYIELEILK